MREFMLNKVSDKLIERGYFSSRYLLLLLAYILLLIFFYFTQFISVEILGWSGISLISFYILINIIYSSSRIIPDQKASNESNSDSESDFHEKNNILHSLVYPENIQDSVFEVASLSRPHSLFGGDLVFQMKDFKGNYWFAIGDSSGHDLNSHLFSMMILNQLSYLINVCETPLEVNHKLNESLKSKINKNNLNLFSYASLAILKADSKGNFIHYGQHPNMILFRKNKNENDIIETTGGFVGLDIAIGNSNNSEGTFQMNQGDILFSFTDGVFEQKDANNKYFGFKLYDYIKSEDKSNIKQLISVLFKQIENFSATEINDDMTILVIKKI
jgi:phosphoserine phosphatase RsbU/P